MGIVINQSFKNTITTYLGFGIGAVNTLFLYTNFISDTYYGLVAFVLSTANIMMPLMAFGVHNTLIKFYSTFKTKNSLNSFLTLMLFLPLLISIPLGLIGYFCYDIIGDLLSQENTIVKDYVWHIFLAACSMAYFEVFFAWAKTQMQTVFGNFLKEVFHRLGIMALLFAVFFEFITVNQFINGVIWVYVLRMVLMMLSAFSIRLPVFTLRRIDNLNSILKYSFLIIIAGSIATVILDVDKFMLGQYIAIEEVAYYSVAVYIATVISVPQRAMHQIMLPMTAQFLNDKNKAALEDLYKRSSLNLYVISGFIFILIIVNINQLYTIIPEEFRNGVFVVFLISSAKLTDNILGNNNAILFNSDYYRMVLLFGVVLTILTVVLNMIFIPMYGINGSALATFLAVIIYNSIKIVFVKKKLHMLPFTDSTFKLSVLITLSTLVFYFWDFGFHAILNIILKSVIVTIIYVIAIYRMKVSDDLSQLIKKYLKL
ncbi:polysaccharide biosynthesis C-terminal domain-containing protein [Geojedonia litorea]|uniref:Polysaccharide biosynthesis C-terminal domain-containing protein n=1 Tax=Geojedonia litorea TaxID=1268269 RepID=A0ABV9N4R0_9FLAO